MELRELESKLKSAYLNKERAAQIAEQEAMRFETLVSTVLVDFRLYLELLFLLVLKYGLLKIPLIN